MPRRELEHFRVEYLQILDEAGRVDTALEPSIPGDDLRKLYRTMRLARALDVKMLSLQRQGRLVTFAPAMGQEAAQLGAVYALRPTDWMVPAFREQAASLWRGTPLRNILLYYMGMEEGNFPQPGVRDLPIAIPVATQLPHAVGIAWAAKLRGKDEVALTFFGDGATSAGDFHEACNMAGVYQVPVILLCQNNQYAISTPREKQTRSRTLAQKAIAYGFPGIQVDGNDLLAVYVATKEAMDRAIHGGGPTLMEAVTYRLGAHTTADDPKRYRTEEEVERARQRDPLPRTRRYLEQKGLWDDAQQTHLDVEVEEQVNREVDAAEAELARGLDPSAMFDYVYAMLPPELRRQRDEVVRQKRAVSGGQ
ncbi:MAG: pyruvate dehydrogenase (acetyl-transferring) E1 component subunit alpha [Planctomycetes bacterium]|nr:pyruvate dehydrogenase (acetyl-transferring) E1 component subunit alpha [Planctomycetota bacterium]